MVACMNEADATPDPRALYPSDHCPLCGGDNQCAMAAAGSDNASSTCASCWCQQAQIPTDVLNCIPAQARGVACICAACARRPAPITAPGVHRVVDQGQRPAIQLDADGQRVIIAQTGAQVLSWHTGDGDILWTASEPKYRPLAPVRGGVPVVFPWFGDHKTDPDLPAHGFARSIEWRVADQRPAQVTLRASDDGATRKLWDHAFCIELEVALKDGLRITMTVNNTGTEPLTFEQALHTYFAVGDIQQAAVHGLEGVDFVEHAREPEGSWDTNSPIRFRAETDRVFQGCPSEMSLRASALGRTVTLQTDNARSAIVWNPWPNKTARLSQMTANDWRDFCCIESANVGESAVTLEPGASHQMTLTLRAKQD